MFTLFSCFFFFQSVPDPPLIDLSCSRVYNEATICWRLSDDHIATDHQLLEYRRLAICRVCVCRAAIILRLYRAIA